MKNHGGKRKGAGRKADKEKSEVIRLYIKPKKLKKLGDIKQLRSELYEFIEKKLQNN